MHLRWSWFLTAAILAGCYTAPEGWDTPAASGGATGAGCVAGMRVECPCTDGSTGVQECNPDGLSYGSCECSGGGGAGGGSVDGSGGLGGAAPGVGGDVATGGSDSGGTGGAPGPQGPRCDWVPECEALLESCRVTFSSNCGDVGYGIFVCGNYENARQGYAFDDEASFPCSGEGLDVDCASASQLAGDYCAEKVTQGAGGAAGTGGSGGSGGGNHEPAVLWSVDRQTPPQYHGALATGSSYHRAKFTDATCLIERWTPHRPTGWTGHSDIQLSEPERSCIRSAGHCDEVQVTWNSCNQPSTCSSYQASGVTWVAPRPACSGADLSGDFYIRHTVRALGPELVDETWALVVE